MSWQKNLKSNVILAPWGCDFAFPDATPWFHSMDILIKYMQKNQEQTHVYVQYSTLSEYFSHVMSLTNITYPTNVGGDFFPLDEDLYWTGYYTSRTELKGLTRQGEAVAHVVEPLFSIGKVVLTKFPNTAAYSNITTLRLANADAQHHDGVTGTSVPEVVDMYSNDLIHGMEVSLDTSAAILSSYISKGQNLQAVSSSYGIILSIKAGQVVPVVIYNSLGWPRNDYVAIPVNTQGLIVLDTSNATVPSQVNPVHIFNTTAKFNLFFQTSIPPFGFTAYFITTGPVSDDTKTVVLEPTADATLNNGYLSVTLSGTTGRISHINNTISAVAISVDQNILGYTSQHSGAYAFGPAGSATPLATKPPTNTLTSGPLVTEVYQVFPTKGQSSFAKQNVRIYHSPQKYQSVSGFVEISFELGELPSYVEVVSSFASSVQNKQAFFTDDNGFEFLERQAVYSQPIEANYYPTIYSSFIKDTQAQLSLISDRTHGASSLSSGELELMVHRNPDMGDGFGPGLTDTTVVFPVIRVIVDTPKASPIQVRTQPYLLNFPLTFFTGSAVASVADWKSKYATSAQFISGALPPNVHFLSLYALDDSTTSTKSIFRLTHLFAVGEDPIYSSPVSVDVAKLFSNFKIASFVETTLTANKVLVSPAPTVVTLSPKQIRTFVIEF